MLHSVYQLVDNFCTLTLTVFGKSQANGISIKQKYFATRCENVNFLLHLSSYYFRLILYLHNRKMLLMKAMMTI